MLTTYLIIILIGLVIGSFLNVVIIRYPHVLMREWRSECMEFLNLPRHTTEHTRFNIMTPRSQCTACHQQLSIWHNIPLLSYLYLRGRCAYCQKSISIQYPIVELLCAITTLIVFLQWGISTKTGALWILTWGLIALGGIDWRTQILPDNMTLSLLWLGLILNMIGLFTPPANAIGGAVLGYLFFWIVNRGFLFIRKKQGMGHGDFKMLALFGAWLGIVPMLHIVLVAVFLGLFAHLTLWLTRLVRRDQPLPFGPALAIAGWFVAVFGPTFSERLTNWF